MAETTSTKVAAAAPANIALIGAGWWSQGWHLPALHNNCNANIIAIVDPSPHPQSTLDPNLQPLSVLKDKYQAAIYSSTDEMLNDIGPQLDGVLIATPHATHYEVCRQVMTEIERRNNNNNDTEADRRRPLHILMEKPMTTHISHAIDLYNMVQNVPDGGSSKFWINHSANFRSQAAKAREIIASGRLGRIRHVTGFFASPLKWIFEDPGNTGWNEPSEGMLANGFAWGQSSHLFAFLYHILGDDLEPVDVFCSMTHSDVTGADISHSATVRCRDVSQDNNNNNDFIIMNVTGTTLLPGNAHSDPPVPKLVRVEVYGNDGSLHYGGNDREPDSGQLEVRTIDGSMEVMDPEFLFENLDSEGNGPESLQNFVKLCCGDSDVYTGADVIDGLRSVQTIDAMYRSHASSRLEEIVSP